MRYPTSVRKTSLYLADEDVARLRRLASLAGKSQAEIVRAAVAAYEESVARDRAFELAGAWEGDGTSVADLTEADLLRRFGE
jgi:hypothetical protein